MKVTPPDFIAELVSVLGDTHTITLDPDCTGGIEALGDDETLVGEVPPGLPRILYLVSRHYDRLSAEQQVIFEFSADGSKAEAISQRLGNLYNERANAYRYIFWTVVHETYPPVKGGVQRGLTLRQGWGLVETPTKDAAVMALLDLLKGRRG